MSRCDDLDCPGWIVSDDEIERCDSCATFLADADAKAHAGYWLRLADGDLWVAWAKARRAMRLKREREEGDT